MAVSVKQISSLRSEIEELKEQIAQDRGVIKEMKKSDKGLDGETIRDRLVKLKVERVENEIKLQESISRYRSLYYKLHDSPTEEFSE